MADKVVLPKMGVMMEEGTITQWFVQDGDTVAPADPLFSFETEKIDTEVTAEARGTVHILQPVDATVVPGTVVAYILAVGEALPEDALVPSPDSAAAPGAATARQASLPTAETPSPSGAGGPRVKASPTARRLAEEQGLDLARIEGSGPGGRILRRDVEEVLCAGEAAPSSADLPYRGIRRTIGQRMLQSVQTMAPLTLAMDADMTEAVKLRVELADAVRVTYTDLLVKAAALALREHPRLNARLDGDAIRTQPHIHIGFAVALEEGLIVPVVRDADAKPLDQIAREAAELADRARGASLTPDDVAGGTFTVTSLGMFGVDLFTPIINPPQAAILGVGRVVDRPVFTNDTDTQIERRSFLTLSLTFDHRLLDGAPAAQFLQTLRTHLENPTHLLESG